MLKMGASVSKSRSRNGHAPGNPRNLSARRTLMAFVGRPAAAMSCAEMGFACAMSRHAKGGYGPNRCVAPGLGVQGLRGLRDGSAAASVTDIDVMSQAEFAASAHVRCSIRKVRIKVTCRFAKKRGKTPAKSCQRTISGVFRCIGATGDCPRRKGQIRLRRSDFLPDGKSPVTTTNKGNQP